MEIGLQAHAGEVALWELFWMGFQLLLKLMTWCRPSDVAAWVIGNLGLKQLQLRIVCKNPFHLISDSLTLLHQNVCTFVGKSLMWVLNTFE